MSIAFKPEDSKKLMLQELDSASGDQWTSLNLSEFIPQELQQAIEAIEQLLDTVAEAMEYTMALSRLVKKLTTATTDLVAMVIRALADSIKAMLDLIPKTDTGVYLLWIPTAQGGNNYYRKTFSTSVVDQDDYKRPPEDEDLHLYSLFFLWGSPMYDKEIATRVEDKYAKFNSPKEVFKIENNLKQYFGVDNKIPSWALVPKPKDFAAKKSFFTKSKSTKDEVASLVKLPQSTNLDGVDSTIKFLRSSIIKISRKSEVSGVMANISWTYPKGYRGTSLTNVRHGTSIQGNTRYYTESTTKIIGIEILFSDNQDDLKIEISKLHNASENPLAFTQAGDYEDNEEQLGNVTRIHKKLDGMPDNTFYTQVLPDAEYDEKGEVITRHYYFASAFVYINYMSSIQVDYDTDKVYRIYELVNGNTASKTLRSEWDTTAPNNHSINFDSISPKKISYKLPTLDDGVVTLVSDLTAITRINSDPLRETAGGAEPNWVSMRGVQELVPELKGIVDRAKAYVDNIADSWVDDVEAFQDWIDIQLQDITDMASEIEEMSKLIKKLLFPPMAGVHYLSIETHYGIHDIAKRLRKSMDSTIPNSSIDYNPALLDQEFMDENDEYIDKAAAVPAYSNIHYTGGFVLVFQDPEVNKFLERLMGISNSFTDTFNKIYNDFRLKTDHPVLPTFTTWEKPKHPRVAIDYPVSPTDVGRNESDHKSGRNEVDDEVNTNGNVEILTKPGPFDNTGVGGNFTLIYNDEDTSDNNTGDYDNRNDRVVSVYIPKGRFTAAEIASKAASRGHSLFTVVDGALYWEANSFSVAPCSGDIAQAMGIKPDISKRAPKISSIEMQGEAFGANKNDLIIQLETNGMPTLDMLKAVPAIWQFKPFKNTNLSPTYHKTQITIEGVTAEIDVTGNAGANPIDATVSWQLATTFPLVLTDANNKFLFDFVGAPPEVTIPAAQVIVLQEATYSEYNELGASLLHSIYKAGYPIGLFTTIKADDETYTELVALPEWGSKDGVSIIVSPDPATPSQDFLQNLTTNITTASATGIPYVIEDVVDNLNASFSKDYFSITSNNAIRIEGSIPGCGNSITVYGSDTNPEYAIVAKDIFGLDFIRLESTVATGFGEPMSCFAYAINMETPVLCSTLEDSGQQNMETEIETTYYEVVIETSRNYYIEMLNQI